MSWKVGQELQGGKYRIQKILGQGGFGTAYEAWHMFLKQQVVIKTPNESKKFIDSDKSVERFVQEGQTLAKLSEDHHPHIVRVRDLFQEEETYCLVMDYVQGETLLGLVYLRERLSEAKAVKYVEQIGEALSYLHERGFRHRDVHPGNIIVQDNDKAVLIDFGITKKLVPTTLYILRKYPVVVQLMVSLWWGIRIFARLVLNSTDKAGNRSFAPYEQIIKGSCEPTVDIYSLAATLYYVVTGKSPSSSWERKFNNINLIPPKSIVPELSEELNHAILKGMEIEAEDRPQSMQAWLQLLEVAKKVLVPNSEVVPTGIAKTRSQIYRRSKTLLKMLTSPSFDLASQQKFLSQIFKKSSVLSFSELGTRKVRTLAWDWLLGVSLCYASTGFILAKSSTVFWIGFWAAAKALALVGIGAGAWAGAWAMARAGIEAEVWVGSVAIALALTLVVAGVWVWSVAGVWVGVLTLAGVGFWAWAGSEVLVKARTQLLKSFSGFYASLILLRTSLLGLGLGWLAGSG